MNINTTVFIFGAVSAIAAFWMLFLWQTTKEELEKQKSRADALTADLLNHRQWTDRRDFLLRKLRQRNISSPIHTAMSSTPSSFGYRLEVEDMLYLLQRRGDEWASDILERASAKDDTHQVIEDGVDSWIAEERSTEAVRVA